MAIHGPSSIEQHPSSLSLTPLLPTGPSSCFHLLKDFGHYRGPSSNLVGRTEQSERALSAPPTCMHTCECRIFTAFVEVHTVCNAGDDSTTIRRYCRQFLLGCAGTYALCSVTISFVFSVSCLYPPLRTVTCTVLYEEMSSTRNRVGLRHRAFTRPAWTPPTIYFGRSDWRLRLHPSCLAAFNRASGQWENPGP